LNRIDIINIHKLFLVKRLTRSGDYEPICIYDENNNYRGVAVFSDRVTAEQYPKSYRDKLILHFSKASGSGSTRANLKAKFKVFEVDAKDVYALMRGR
jgi:hypothetical protein